MSRHFRNRGRAGFVSAALVLVFFLFLFTAWTLPPGTDRINCTELNGDGCVCHTTVASPLVKVWVTGPDTLREGQSGTYKMFLAGPPAIGGGYNIATRFGTLDILDTVSVLVDNEITQRIPLPFPSVHDTIHWEFKYTAPVGVPTDTIYSCGLSVNLDGEPSDADQWAYGPKFKVHILPKLTPVELVSFSASRAADGNVLLRWQTATELNNKEFIIERSSSENAGEWKEAGRVNGSGTTSSPKQYTFEDSYLFAAHYRLRQIDFDGSEHYSPETEVAAGRNEAASFALLGNFPNPFNPSTTIRFTLGVRAETGLNIYDISGRRVAVLYSGIAEAGEHSITWNATGNAAGVYVAELRSGNFRSAKKIALLP